MTRAGVGRGCLSNQSIARNDSRKLGVIVGMSLASNRVVKAIRAKANASGGGTTSVSTNKTSTATKPKWTDVSGSRRPTRVWFPLRPERETRDRARRSGSVHRRSGPLEFCKVAIRSGQVTFLNG